MLTHTDSADREALLSMLPSHSRGDTVTSVCCFSGTSQSVKDSRVQNQKVFNSEQSEKSTVDFNPALCCVTIKDVSEWKKIEV